MKEPLLGVSASGLIPTVIFLMVAGLIMQIGWIVVPAASLPHRPFEEDTFFHLTACRNLAQGDGISINGRPTSGAQFGTLIYTLAYWVFPGADDEFHLRMVRLLSFCGSVFSGAAVGFFSWALFHRSLPNAGWIAALSTGLWMASFQVFRINMNGYETVFATSLFLLTAAFYVLRWERNGSARLAWDLGLGLGFGLCVLARVDLGIWALVAAVVFWLFHPARTATKSLCVLIWAVVAALVSLPLWLHNLSAGGALMPISGKASAYQLTFHGYGESVGRCLLRAATGIGEFPLISFYTPYLWGDRWEGLLVAGMGLGLGALAWRQWSRSWTRQLVFPRAALGAVLVFSLALLIYYSFAHGSWWFMKRYLHPLRGVFFAFAGPYLLLLVAWGRQRWQAYGVPFFCGGFLAISVLQYVLSYGDTTSNTFVPVAKWINANLPPEAKKGAFQSGTLGYFCENISNLDGKNNPDALRALLEGALPNYLEREKFDYVIDWPMQVQKYLDMEFFLKKYQPIAEIGPTTVYQRVSSK